MNKLEPDSNTWEERNQKNHVRLALWTGAWVASTALAAFGPKVIWNFDTLLTMSVVIINLVFGFGAIMAAKRWLLGEDEMFQKIFLNASAVTLGVGFVCAGSYELLEDIKLIPFEPEISHLTILMCLTFMISMVIGNRKYR